MRKLRKMYQAPDLLEVGKATTLTLGSIGCADDGKQCEKLEPQTLAF